MNGPPDAWDWAARDAEHQRREARAEVGGGSARQARQTRLGRLNARERIAGLVDAGSFVEVERYTLHRHADASEALAANQHPGDGLVGGYARIDGRAVVIYAHDPTVLRGALGHAASRKVVRLLDAALARSLPVIALADSDGVRIPEGTDAIDAYGDIISRTIRLRRRAPQFTLISGLCVGAAAYTAALTDWVGMVGPQSYLFITGPKVAQVVTGERVTLESLGGAEVHARQTGACHAVLADENAGLAWLKRLLGALASTPPASLPPDPADRLTERLRKLVPTARRRAYDMRKVVRELFDAESYLELAPGFAGNLLTGLARLGGQPVAVVASQPLVLAGCLDIDASRKGAHLVDFAGRFGLPIVTLVDVPGYLPGQRQESGGIVPFGAELLRAYGEAPVPKLCLVVRKSYGGASVLSFAADHRLALPTAEVAPMGSAAAAEVELGPLTPESTEEQRATREAFITAWEARHGDVWSAAEAGWFDQVVAPEQARAALVTALRALTGVDR